MCQVETSESLEGVFRGGLINRGKNVQKDSIHCINCQGHCLISISWGNLTGSVLTKEPSIRYSLGIGIFCLTEAGEHWVPQKD